jgi:hypothetical protein
MDTGWSDTLQEGTLLPRACGVTRREVLASAIGTLAFPTTALDFAIMPQVHLSPRRRRASRAIQVFLTGGPSHLDLWDPKPGLAETMRSSFLPIPTKLDGIRFTELLPRLAGINDRFALIRSMHCDDCGVFSHDAAMHQMITGRVSQMSDHAGIITAIEGDFAKTRPQTTGSIDANGSNILSATGDLRKHIVETEINAESPRTRNRYGNNVFGQELLVARRLVEKTPSVIRVHWPWRDSRHPNAWDGHDNLSIRLKHSGPILDNALSSLLTDLDDRGLLDETVVSVVGEFGRSPRRGVSTSGNLTRADGRDHWPHCFSAVLAGGGIGRGIVYGESDECGAYPARDPVSHADLFATLQFVLRSIGSSTQSNDSANAPTGRVVRGLLV